MLLFVYLPPWYYLSWNYLVFFFFFFIHLLMDYLAEDFANGKFSVIHRMDRLMSETGKDDGRIYSLTYGALVFLSVKWDKFHLPPLFDGLVMSLKSTSESLVVCGVLYRHKALLNGLEHSIERNIASPDIVRNVLRHRHS